MTGSRETTVERVGARVRAPGGVEGVVVQDDRYHWVQVEWDDGETAWAQADLLEWL